MLVERPYVIGMFVHEGLGISVKKEEALNLEFICIEALFSSTMEMFQFCS